MLLAPPQKKNIFLSLLGGENGSDRNYSKLGYFTLLRELISTSLQGLIIVINQLTVS